MTDKTDSDSFIYDIFQDSGLIIDNDHFVYSFGRHGRAYVDHYALYANRPVLEKLCRIFVDCLDESVGRKINVVVGPEGGGILLAELIAKNLERKFGRNVASIWAKKGYRKNGEKFFYFPEAFGGLVFQKNVLAVDDIMTTGGTMKVLIELSRIFEGEVVGCGCLWNRGGIGTADLYDIPFFVPLEKKLEDWDPVDCPLCKAGVPVNTKSGHGKEFLKK